MIRKKTNPLAFEGADVASKTLEPNEATAIRAVIERDRREMEAIDKEFCAAEERFRSLREATSDAKARLDASDVADRRVAWEMYVRLRKEFKESEERAMELLHLRHFIFVLIDTMEMVHLRLREDDSYIVRQRVALRVRKPGWKAWMAMAPNTKSKVQKG